MGTIFLSDMQFHDQLSHCCLELPEIYLTKVSPSEAISYPK